MTLDPHRYGYERLDFTLDLADALPAQADGDLDLALDAGPHDLPAAKANSALTGTQTLRIAATEAGKARRVIASGLEIGIEAGTELRYIVCPQLDEELSYASTFVSLDAQLQDGRWISEIEGAELTDQYGIGASAAAQGEGKILLVNHWNTVRLSLHGLAGSTIESIAVLTEAPGPVHAWLDQASVGLAKDRSARDTLAEHVDTRRGTHSSGAYSRGNNAPATAMPNGFTFLVPFTDASSDRWMYSWAGHTDENNSPVLQGVGLSHIPSPWMGDRNQLVFHPVAGGEVPDATLTSRQQPFSHDNERAHPHLYDVTVDGGTQVTMTPTDHGGLFTFTFAPGTHRSHVIIDAAGTGNASADGPVRIDIDPHAGTVTGWSDHGSGLSVGRSRMYFAGRFDRPMIGAGYPQGDREHAQYATFDLSAGNTVELRLATSFISTEQAWHTYDLELAQVPGIELLARAQIAWEDRLGVLELPEATAEQLASAYGSLYRLNLYPSNYAENVGTTADPILRHASPVAPHTGAHSDTHTGAAVIDGAMYVNHGFWDTYRTCWSAYALLYPQIAAELADGFVQQFREGGWIARWSSPGYADLMTGTSSDVAFADLAARGVDLLDPLATYDAALRNATVVPDHKGVGRKGVPFHFLRGYAPTDSHESVSWSTEGYINDAGIAELAKVLLAGSHVPESRRSALREEAIFFAQRARGYVDLFDGETGHFRGRDREGNFGPATEFDPEVWGGDYTETNAWNFAFHAPHDGNGLAGLHGGPEGLARVLETFLSTPEKATKKGTYGGVIHEMIEARDVQMGQLGQSNQPSHHIGYIPLFAGRPDLTQEIVREILTRLWTGNDLGQGYHGDEDNGEMSAWYLMSALGIYPLRVGSDQWVIGSPLVTRAIIHRPDGDLVIEAPGNTIDTPYVHGVWLDTVPVGAAEISHEALRTARTLRFEMADEPGAWGSATPPASLSEPGDLTAPWRDVSASGEWDGGVQALADDLAETTIEVGQRTLTWSGPDSHSLTGYTLMSAAEAAAPSAWTVEVRDGEGDWQVIDRRSGQVFAWALQLRPFVFDEPVTASAVRIRFDGEGSLAQAELLAQG